MTEENKNFDYRVDKGGNDYVVLRRNDVFIAFMVPKEKNYRPSYNFLKDESGNCYFQHYKEQGFVETEIGSEGSLEEEKYRVVCADSLSDAVRKAKYWNKKEIEKIEDEIEELERKLALFRGYRCPSLSIWPSPSDVPHPAPDGHGSEG